ncbi:MAG: cytochrome c biogenesis CcdA family protein [Candidatus Aenigmatarchaeota archaeon]
MTAVFGTGPLWLAFTAGLFAFFNPCTFALLPAYLSFFMGGKEERSDYQSTGKSLYRGAKLGGLATLGFVAVFGGIGIIVNLISSQIRSYLSLAMLAIGPIFIILGSFWLMDEPVLSLSNLNVELSRSSLFLFGATYALGSLACVFPVFLMVVVSAISTGGILSGLAVFIAYILGMGSLMISVTVSASFSKKVLLNRFSKVIPYVHRISGVLLIIAGIYLVIYYWVPSGFLYF